VNITPEERAAGELSPERLRAAIRTFQDVGYVVLQDMYDPEFLQEVRAGYEAMLDEYLAGRGGLDALEGKTFGKNHIGFHPPLVPPVSDERIVAHPVAVQLMSVLLGKDFQCGFYNTNTAMPGSGIQPVHKDTLPLFGAEMNVPHPVHVLVVNVPLCDFTLENGSTEVWPGSHLIIETDPEDWKRLEERARNLRSERTNLTLGSLVLRDMRMWHRGMPNHADYPRAMAALVYSRGFLRTGTLEIPRATWEGWGEAARHIFRHNRLVDEPSATNTGPAGGT
jgi:ectoine hydroxylase-related dioxygenase (phytanoyl-CoA dioxygenase family)